MTEAEKQELERREGSVGRVGSISHPDGSKTRVRVTADHGPTLEVETVDETENYTFSVLFDSFTL